MDPYAALGVAPGADEEALRAAYREAVQRWHPDRDASPQAAERFLAAQQAWEVLGDPERRAAHDRRRGTGDVMFVRSDSMRRTVARWVRAGQAVWADIAARRRSRDLE